MKPIEILVIASIFLYCVSPSRYQDTGDNLPIDSRLIGKWIDGSASKIIISTNGQIKFVNADSQKTGNIFTHSNSSFKISIPTDTFFNKRLFIYYIQNDSLIFTPNTYYLTCIGEHNGIVGKWKYDSLLTFIYNSNIAEMNRSDSIIFSSSYSIDSNIINYTKNWSFFESGTFYSLFNDTLVMGSYNFNKNIYRKSK
jgi:hypothetical protein